MSQIAGGMMQAGAPTENNPLLMKMDQQQRKSSVGFKAFSQSGKSRKKGGTSVMSKVENFEEMSIEEVDALIMKVQNEIAQALDIKKRILKHKMMTKKSKNKKLQPVEQELAVMRQRLAMLDQIKDAKIPFYEKLPKDSPFYKHYMSLLYSSKINNVMASKIAEDRNFLMDV
jgi:hypothetical protein